MQMSKKLLTSEQKKLDNDLWIILGITLASFLTYSVNRSWFNSFMQNASVPVLYRLLLNAAIQFGVAGLGITVVALIRNERFSKFGLVKKNTVKSVAGAVISFVPYIVYIFATSQFKGYRPLGIRISDVVLVSSFPVKIVGMLIIAIVWGFFEGFNFAVISDKINARYPSKIKWLDIGAAVCAVVCILFHPFSLTLLGVIEMISVFIAIYGMLTVKRITGNSWGCVFAFLFVWNAF